MQVVKKIKKASTTGRGRVILGAICLTIAAIIVGGILFWKLYKKKIIREQLEAAVKKKTGGMYKVSYEKLELDELNGFLSVQDFLLTYDSTVLQNAGDNAPAAVFIIAIPRITITGVKTPRALLEKEIVGSILALDQPVISLFYTGKGKDTVRATPDKAVYEQILGNLNLIRLDSIYIRNGTISTARLGKTQKALELNRVNITLGDIAVDSTANADTTRLLFSRSLIASCSRFSWRSAVKPYEYAVDSIAVHSPSSSVFIKSFSVNPLLGEDAFVKSLPTQDDRFDFLLKDIHVTGVNMPALLSEKIWADSMYIAGASFKIYRDLSVARDKKNRVGTYPHQAIAKIPLPFNLKKMIVGNAYVEYKEKNPRTNQAGKVRFQQAYATITNITNQPGTGQNLMTAHIQTRFLNKVPLTTTWKFYLFHPRGRFDVKGSLGSIPATQVNELTRPMGPAAIEDGMINHLSFNLAGDDYGMNGEVKFLYKNLKVGILKKDEDSKKLEKKKLASLAANIILKNNNPSGKEEPRVITVKQERDTNRSIFHLSWKTLFSGIKQTAGINK